MKVTETRSSGNRLIVLKGKPLVKPVVLTPEEADELKDELEELE